MHMKGHWTTLQVYTKKERTHNLEAHVRVGPCKNPAPVSRDGGSDCSFVCKELKILGVNFQEDVKFSQHLGIKLKEANNCLCVPRLLRKEGYQQDEIDLLFNAIVILKITYGISVHGSSKTDLNTI